jgi:glycosyltransferase involved in cell wall biosynthesis
VIASLIVGIVKLRKYDILFCESPPLFLGIAAYLLRLIKGGRLIMNISDLWPASPEATGLIRSRLLLGIAERLESFLYRRSDQVCGQTQGIVDYIDAKLSGGKTYLLRNGVDLDFYSADNAVTGWRESAGFAEEDFVLLYAGIIGYFQGLEVIINAAARLSDHRNIRFALVGSGPVKEKLIGMRDQLGAENVSFFDTVPKSDMPSIISECDAGIIPLKDIELFRGAVPSKAFEYLALKKPILLGVRGEAKDLLIDKGKCGLAFEPEDDQDLSKQILKLNRSAELSVSLGENGYKCVSENFSRNMIADAFWKNLIETGKRKARF